MLYRSDYDKAVVVAGILRSGIHMDWSRQGGAVVSRARLADGRAARVVLVANRENSKGVMVILADAPPEQNAFPLSKLLDAFHPNDAVDILCLQERVFGPTALEVPDIP